MNTNRKVNAWAISYGLRRYHAQQTDLLLFPDVRTTENVNRNPQTRLPFDAPTLPRPLFTWKRDLCVFEKGVDGEYLEKIFIYNPQGLPVDTAETQAEAVTKVDRLNNPTPRDAGVRRFATGNKYSVKGDA